MSNKDRVFIRHSRPILRYHVLDTGSSGTTRYQRTMSMIVPRHRWTFENFLWAGRGISWSEGS